MNLENILNRIDDFQLGVDKVKAVIDYLKYYGYLVKDENITVEDIIEAIKKFQDFFGLTKDGKVGPKVLKLVMASRCGNSDAKLEMAAALQSQWRKRNLTYFIESYVDGLDRATVAKVLDSAWTEWENVTNISLKQVDNSQADIIISTGSGRRSNFDGPSGTLAWAYLPNGNDSQLLMRFDLSETWTVNPTDRGILLKNVACHEFGHLLGLEHSSVQSALMAPYYNANVSKPQSNDDIPRIQSKYGKPIIPPPPVTPPTPPVTPVPDTLTINIEGKTTIQLDGKITIPGYRINKIGT